MAQQHDSDGDAWTWAALEPEPTERERAMLDRFAEEYLVDGDPTKAASRIGFQGGFAVEYGKRFITRSYVQRRIEQLKHAQKDPRREKEYMKNVVVSVLHAVATQENQKGAARVAAAAKLSSIFGLEGNGPGGIGPGGPGVPGKGGVIIVPAIADIDEWEAVAMAQQAKLIEDSRVE